MTNGGEDFDRMYFVWDNKHSLNKNWSIIYMFITGCIWHSSIWFTVFKGGENHSSNTHWCLILTSYINLAFLLSAPLPY